MKLDINEKCFEWVGEGFKIGRSVPHTGFKFVSMEDAYFKYLAEPFRQNNDDNHEIIQVDKSRNVIRKFSIKEVNRILKLSKI